MAPSKFKFCKHLAWTRWMSAFPLHIWQIIVQRHQASRHIGLFSSSPLSSFLPFLLSTSSNLSTPTTFQIWPWVPLKLESKEYATCFFLQKKGYPLTGRCQNIPIRFKAKPFTLNLLTSLPLIFFPSQHSTLALWQNLQPHLTSQSFRAIP